MAEIVGTLMLVLIVVAAATAFAFFVSSEEQTTLADQTALHYKNLENVTIQTISNSPPPNSTTPGSLVIVLSSSDIYSTNITDIAVGGDPITSFCQTPVRTGVVPCTGMSAVYQEFSAAGGQGYVNLTPFTVTVVTVSYTSTTGFLLPFTFPTGTVQILMGTVRGNEFTTSLYPPIAEFGLNFITNFPVLDGTLSYQPHSGISPDTSINSWVWNVKSNDSNYLNKNYAGQQVQLPHALTSGDSYLITLTVTNTLGLTGTTSGNYTAP
ncbi:MAG: hypothetical protein WB809_06545 [Thermoplasmata archaeon]